MGTAGLRYNAESTGPDRQLISGRYRACERIGRGRLGEIFSAVDESDEHLGVEYRVALQVIPEAVVRNNALFNRLNVGYSTLCNHSHPNIVNFRRFGRHGNRGYLVMDLLDGASLRVVMDDAGMLPPDEVRPVIRSIAEALQFLHANGFIHGRLTASNVFVTDELEIRLLDVLPLGAEQAIIGGGATSSTFSRSSIRDDVFGLACIAYEMLSGRHPYNYNSPAEAQQAGLRVDRLSGVTGAEWSALQQALSLDEHGPTPTVSNFVHSFGINGAERLRPSSPQRGTQGPLAMPAADPAIARLPVSMPPPQFTSPLPVADPDVSIRERRARTMPVRRPPRRRRALLLTMLLSLIIAWTYHGSPRTQITALTDYIEHGSVQALAKLWDDAIPAPTTDARPSLSTASSPQLSDSTTTAAADERAATGGEDPDVQTAASAVDAVPTVVDAPDLSTPPAEPRHPLTDDVADVSASEIDEATATTIGRMPIESEPQAGVGQRIVTVSEGDSVARIAIQATGYSEFPLIWWTSEHTARAGDDFVAVEQRIVANASTNDGVLLVPLVNDSLPEPPESFFVSTGFRDTRHGHIERIATVRVDITDDD